ncbi:hypothetical protein [Dyadobacter bucti]|uniref:hypothetical protein n=1 Tax=Dyadobacter bucti TaxID=2572203 RepID=UPI00140DA62A|nr:hypothetical protein [Dyadobacter bucti]
MERQISGYLDEIERLRAKVEIEEKAYAALNGLFTKLIDQKMAKGQFGSLS